MEQYLPVLLMLIVGAAFAIGSIAASTILGPKRATAAKEEEYESGIVPRRATAARFPVRFYLVAMIFIIFDIEVVFLYPWAVEYHQLGKFGLGEMATFAGIVFISFAYLVSNGALDWGPLRARLERPSVDLTRTTTSTVRRVPRPAEVAIDGPGLIDVDHGVASAEEQAEEPDQTPQPVGAAAVPGGSPQSANGGNA